MPTTPKKKNVVSIKSPYFNAEDRLPSESSVAVTIESPYFSPKSKSGASSVEVDTLIGWLIQLKPTLVQESVASDPWKLLVAVTLLNKTAGKLAIPVFWVLVEKWPTPLALSHASEADLVSYLRPLGTYNVRAKRLISLSRAYLWDPPSRRDVRPSRAVGPPISPRKRAKYPHTPISHLPGAGAYALDSYRIFCSGLASEEWKDVAPSDKELIKYLKWKWAVVEKKQWAPETGAVCPLDVDYLKNLISELENNSSSPSPHASANLEASSPSRLNRTPAQGHPCNSAHSKTSRFKDNEVDPTVQTAGT